MTPQNPQCRYTDKNRRCAERAVSATGEVLLCQPHLDLAAQLLRRLGYTITEETP